MKRTEILALGAKLTSGDRDQEYGDPYLNFSATADLMSAFLTHRFRFPIRLTPEDAAQLMVLTKMSRTFYGEVKDDTYVDQATYSAIAGECAARASEPTSDLG